MVSVRDGFFGDFALGMVGTVENSVVCGGCAVVI
jgi:hypothetical protein